MSEVVIQCAGLAKEYQIGERERYKTIREAITTALASLLRSSNSHNNNKNGTESFWALRDVSFEVKRGDVVGIIGRNGAGKSTLLKLLSRITTPTEGRAEIHGRVGSLLEVGTGFHPELSGRDNIYLNGAILGMKRTEIARQFDEIVAFSEIEKFIDTPVKRYSSGMYIRLAFAVAAHLETEILIVDEVLAVGDTQFQKKCLGKMGDVARHGRTVLMVSHNMAAVQSLCGRLIMLQEGPTVRDGNPQEVSRYYLDSFDKEMDSGIVDLRSSTTAREGKKPFFSRLELKNTTGDLTTAYVPGEDLIVELTVDPPFPVSDPLFVVGINDSLGRRVFTLRTDFSDFSLPLLDRETTVVCSVPGLSLAPGRYGIHIRIGTMYDPVIDMIREAGSFDVHESDYFGTGRLPPPDLGSILVKSHWRTLDHGHGAGA